ncbi:SNF2 family N-terminal domain protein [Spiroplasma clarkii]|uniref:SNF2-related protein n=1 Tax=Spiroplasma clarkii TaxID=2139 RepID=UPI000B57119A|nr:SNF2-related protein [Spiroplasma clarkii]ARU90982.1 SNF2 family N-terminal domain protein [Spiroplasma clarkii]
MSKRNFISGDTINNMIKATTPDVLEVSVDLITKSFDGSKELRDYQKKDLAKLISLKRGANFSEQRTGKTPTIIMLCESLKQKVVVIVPPTLVHLTWLPQIKEWAGQEAQILFKKKNDKFYPMNVNERKALYEQFFNDPSSRYLLVSKDTWKTDFRSIVTEDKLKDCILVVDEAHYLKGLRSRSTTTIQADQVYRTSLAADRTYLLTGTPIVNYPSDIYGILKVLEPEVFGSWSSFVDYFWGFDFFNATLKNISFQKMKRS